jgi:hypothetical protein
MPFRSILLTWPGSGIDLKNFDGRFYVLVWSPFFGFEPEARVPQPLHFKGRAVAKDKRIFFLRAYGTPFIFAPPAALLGAVAHGLYT